MSLTPKSYIYIAESNNRYRFGLTADVAARIAAIQSASPHPVALAASFDGDESLEMEIAKTFAPYHISGEWYALPSDWRAMLPVDVTEA